MTPYLLDVNVFMFARKKEAGFRTSSITKTGFVRISSNPKFTPDAANPLDALALLDRLLFFPGIGSGRIIFRGRCGVLGLAGVGELVELLDVNVLIALAWPSHVHQRL